MDISNWGVVLNNLLFCKNCNDKYTNEKFKFNKPNKETIKKICNK